jgi:hypothetical protein
MNVIRRAQAQAAHANDVNRRHVQEEEQRRPTLEDGELLWVGEYKNRDVRSYKLTKGDKTLMTDKEQKLFVRTPYERGFSEHIYEGQIKPGERARPDPRDPRAATREGQGITWYPSGSMFEGGWRNDVRHGFGYMSCHTGFKYSGEWKHDTPEGKGYDSIPNGTTYDGTFSNGNPSGSGVLLYDVAHPNYRYEGEFLNGLRHGKGVIFYENGDVFSGTFDMGKRHGRGITSTSSYGRETQYETEWEQDVLIKGPSCIQSTKRVKKPKPSIPFRTQGHLVAADLTKWSVKDDVTELTIDHFMRIKLGFEGLDVHATGSLTTPELVAVWGSGSVAMLEKLDADGNGTVELDEIFAAWYPNVPAHNILRFMQQNINPRVLLRLRGMLNGIRDEMECGFLQVCGVQDPASSDTDPSLHLRQLEARDYKIGGEKFTTANYAAAKQLFDPPHLLEVLEVWYPNIPESTLTRYELTFIDPHELGHIKRDFFRLSRNSLELPIDQFEEAQELFQARIAKQHEENEMRRIEALNAAAMIGNTMMAGIGGAPPTSKRLEAASASVGGTRGDKAKEDDDETASISGSTVAPTAINKEGTTNDNAIEREMEEGFFKGQPEWRIGNSIRISVALLKDIDRFESRSHGAVSIQQLLRYCYPNARCKRMQEILATRKKGGMPPAAGAPCTCTICTVAD